MPRDSKWSEYRRRGIAFIKEVWVAYQRDRVPLSAAGAAYYLQLSLVPLLLLLVSVATYFVTTRQIESVLTSVTAILGPGVGKALRIEVLAVFRHRGVVTSLSLLFGLWTGSQVFVIMELALNEIWHITEGRTFLVRVSRAMFMVILIGVVLILAFILSALMHTLASWRIFLYDQRNLLLPWPVTFIISYLMPLALVTLVFAIAYRYLPARLISWRITMPGAFVAGVLWTIALRFFSWYTSTVVNYSIVYGSLGGLVLLMLWFNYSAQILLIGAEISAILHQHRLAEGVREGNLDV